MKTVLTGVDGTETAESAARTAAGLAQALGAKLVLASAYGKLEVENIEAGGEQYFSSNEDDALTTAQRSAAMLRSDFPDLEIEPRGLEGKPAEALVNLATDIGADLIVVGNRRVQGLARVLGSVAADVARSAPCDVYVAHTH